MRKDSERWKKWFSSERLSDTNSAATQPQDSQVADKPAISMNDIADQEVDHDGIKVSDELESKVRAPLEKSIPVTSLAGEDVALTDEPPESNSPKQYSTAELLHMSEDELIEVLKRTWKCKNNNLEVWGRLTSNVEKTRFWLLEVRSIGDSVGADRKLTHFWGLC